MKENNKKTEKENTKNKEYNKTVDNEININRRKQYINKIKKRRLLKILEVIIIIGIILTILYIIKWSIDSYKRKKIQDELQNYVEVISENNKNNEKLEKEKIDFDSLKKRNKDTKGWLKVNGTSINHPVVQAEDNDYYVHTTIDREYNFGGWPFFDFRNNLDGKDKNIIIYGHNMRDGTMFHDLRYSFNEEWYNKEENQIITLHTITETKKYKIFSMYKVPSEDYYITTNFNNDLEFKEFLKVIYSRSLINFNKKIDEIEQILTLSTCDYNLKNRIVIHAFEIKDEIKEEN